MASKRKKGESSSSTPTPSFDKKRFVSYEASKWYHQLLVNKSLILERGLLPDLEDGNIVEMITKWKWQKFTAQPELAAVNIVKKFYANAKESVNNLVFVRGKWIKMGRKMINHYYGLHKRDFSGYSVYIDEYLDYSEIIAELCEPGTDWRITATQEATNFPSTKLSRYGKAWFTFIYAKIMPAWHRTDVTKERAALLFYITKGKIVDVGELIHTSIKKALEGSTLGGLPHPSLITDLCKLTGVKWDNKEVLQAPLAPIVHSIIVRYKVWEGGLSHPNGLGYTLIKGHPEDPSQQGPSQPTIVAYEIPSEIPGPSSSAIEELNRQTQQNSLRIDLFAAQMERAMKRMNKKMDRIASRQEKMHLYNTSASFSLATILSRMDLAVLSTPFPTRSDYTLPAYPPSDLDNDAKESEEEDDDEEDEGSEN